jgi:MraZ protein
LRPFGFGVNVWEIVENYWLSFMNKFFFSGSSTAKLDEKSRFVLPQSMRFGLVENGALEFSLALGLGGCLAIYRKSDMDKIVEKFQSKAHVGKYQKFFTLFFSTLHQTTCDKVGRIMIPPILKKAANIKNEVVVAGVLNKIEIWPKEVYEENLSEVFGEKGDTELKKIAEEAFALLDEDTKETSSSSEGLENSLEALLEQAKR